MTLGYRQWRVYMSKNSTLIDYNRSHSWLGNIYCILHTRKKSESLYAIVYLNLNGTVFMLVTSILNLHTKGTLLLLHSDYYPQYITIIHWYTYITAVAPSGPCIKVKLQMYPPSYTCKVAVTWLSLQTITIQSILYCTCRTHMHLLYGVVHLRDSGVRCYFLFEEQLIK